MQNSAINPIFHFAEVELTQGDKIVARINAPRGATDGLAAYMRGRLVEDAPLYTQRIDARNAVAHHLAAVNAIDRCYHAAPTEKVRAMRRGLAYAGIYQSHLQQLFMSRASGTSGIAGLITTNEAIGADAVLNTLMGAKDLITILGGRGITPERGKPGGATKGITDDELLHSRGIATELLGFALQVEEAFRASAAAWVKEQPLDVPAYSLATVDGAGSSSLYDGVLRIVDPTGKEMAMGEAKDILPLLLSWDEGAPLRVGPLARQNASVGPSTVQAKGAYEKMLSALGGPPIHRAAAVYWATVIELVQSAELLTEALDRLETGDAALNTPLVDPSEGVAAVEGARGTIIHRYVVDEQGIVVEAQVIPPNAYSEVNAALSTVANGANEVSDALIEEMVSVVRAYQPALVPTAPFPLRITLRAADGKVIDQWRRP